SFRRFFFRSRERRPADRGLSQSVRRRACLLAASLLVKENVMTPSDSAVESRVEPAAASSAQDGFRLTAPHSAPTAMQVTKRSGARESVDLNKIVRAVSRCCQGLADV